jgi:hypothetical protein
MKNEQEVSFHSFDNNKNIKCKNILSFIKKLNRKYFFFQNMLKK